MAGQLKSELEREQRLTVDEPRDCAGFLGIHALHEMCDGCPICSWALKAGKVSACPHIHRKVTMRHTMRHTWFMCGRDWSRAVPCIWLEDQPHKFSHATFACTIANGGRASQMMAGDDSSGSFTPEGMDDG